MTIENCLRWLSTFYDRLASYLMRGLMVHLLPSLAPDRIRLIVLFRHLIKVTILVATVLIVISVIFSSAKVLTVSGMLFDLAGLARIFIDEEWEEIPESFSNINKYPGGPPSYITRELFVDHNPDVLGEVDEDRRLIAYHLYWRRGLAFIILGMALQVIGTIFS